MSSQQEVTRKSSIEPEHASKASIKRVSGKKFSECPWESKRLQRKSELSRTSHSRTKKEVLSLDVHHFQLRGNKPVFTEKADNSSHEQMPGSNVISFPPESAKGT